MFKSVELDPPIEPPTTPAEIPRLEFPLRQHALGNSYTLSTHISPAPRMRITPQIPLPDTSDTSKDGRNRVIREVHENRRRYYAGEFAKTPGSGASDVYEAPGVLWNCANRFVRKQIPSASAGLKPLTLFFAHAIGFTKEIWEPTLQHLLSHPQTGYYIAEIWCFETVQHGDAALINAKNLSGMYDWRDDTRDMLNFLLNYLPSVTPEGAVLPPHLQYVSSAESARRAREGFSDRTLVTIGHSFGGCTIALAALYCPALFSSLALIDPVIDEGYAARPGSVYVGMSIKRKSKWNSKEEALAQLKQVPSLAAWDPDVLKMFVDFGLYTDTRGAALLKMDPVQEAVTYSETRVPVDMYSLFPLLDERIEVRWVMPQKIDLPSIKTPDEDREVARQRVWIRAANSSNVILPAGHLITHEVPNDLAYDIHAFLEQRYGGIIQSPPFYSKL